MATSNAKPKQYKQPQKVFAFDLQKPLFKGNLLKQGEFHRAFKDRFFVLYPGFLVYYDTITTWQYDLQRGETLGSRLNALKLRGGSVDKAKNPPRGAKHAFTVNAPDPSNKRHSVMFNAKSNEERYQWMVKIKMAIPGKPKPKEEKLEEEKKNPASEPDLKEVAVQEPTVITQEPTVTTQEPSQKPPETVITEDSTTDPATDPTSDPASDPATDPTSDPASDPATDPASDPATNPTSTSDPTTDPASESGNDSTTIDNALGPRDTIKSTSSAGSIDLSSPSPEHKPVSSEQTDSSTEPLPDSGTISVVSSVTVEVNQDQKGLPAKKLPQADSLDLPFEQEGLKRDSTARVIDTNETVIPAQNGPTMSIAIANGGLPSFDSDNDDDSDSDDSEGVELPGIQDKESSPSATTPSPPMTNGVSSPSQSPPVISVEEAEEEQHSSPKDDNAVKKEEVHSFPSPTPDRRRPSGVNAFLEKRGYLYKQGGKHKSWHLRYFVLRPGMVTYYKNDPKGKPLGEVKLSKRTKIYMPKPGDKKYSSFQFTLYSPSAWNKRSTYAIAANNKKEMSEWIEAFKLATGLIMDSPENSPK